MHAYMEKNLVQHCCKPEWFAASHKKVDGPHLQIQQITFLLLRVGSILFFVRSCKHSGLQQCCTKFFSAAVGYTVHFQFLFSRCRNRGFQGAKSCGRFQRDFTERNRGPGRPTRPTNGCLTCVLSSWTCIKTVGYKKKGPTPFVLSTGVPW